jgi:hypothetical protein
MRSAVRWIVPASPFTKASLLDELALRSARLLWVKSRHRVTSASCPLLPLKTDINQRGEHVCFVPTADVDEDQGQLFAICGS